MTKGEALAKKIPIFKTDEEEAEYWDTHSPLDSIPEPISEEVRIKLPLDKIMSFRLDGRSWLKLKKLAIKHDVGISTLTRLIIMSALRRL